MPIRKIDWSRAVTEENGECVRCGAPDLELVYRKLKPQGDDSLWWELVCGPKGSTTDKPGLYKEQVRLQLGLCRQCARRADAYMGVDRAHATVRIVDPKTGETRGYRKVKFDHKYLSNKDTE